MPKRLPQQMQYSDVRVAGHPTDADVVKLVFNAQTRLELDRCSLLHDVKGENEIKKKFQMVVKNEQRARIAGDDASIGLRVFCPSCSAAGCRLLHGMPPPGSKLGASQSEQSLLPIIFLKRHKTVVGLSMLKACCTQQRLRQKTT